MALMLMLVLVFPLNATLFSGGSGTEDDPYLVSNITDLENINNSSSAYFLQTNDIDLLNANHPCIPIQKFSGHYDGNGYEISGLYIDIVVDMSSGLFSTNNGTLRRVNVSGQISSAENYIGLLVGENAGLIEKCSSAGSVEGTYIYNGDPYIGGLVGKNTGTIVMSSSTASVEMNPSAYYSGAGGLVGLNKSSGIIENSYARGDIKAVYDGGGLVAYNQSGKIENCYSTGIVIQSGGRSIDNFPPRADKKYDRPGSRSLYFGGFTGFCTGTVINSYWDEESSGTTFSSSGEGRSTEDMAEYPYAQNTFVNWNFDEVWEIDSSKHNGGYPVLSGNECRLLMIVRRSDEKPAFNDYIIPFNVLKGQAGKPGKHGEDGWGISYYTNDYFITGKTGRGTIWYENGPLFDQDKFAHWQPANSGDGEAKFDETVGKLNIRPGIVYQSDWHIIIGHIRTATNPNTKGIPDPHPFIFKAGEGDGIRTYSFAHNGSLSDSTLTLMSDFIEARINMGWCSYTWSKYLWDDEDDTLVDSNTFFGYLMAQIKLNDWDILRGLRAAFTLEGLKMKDACKAWNFVLSDGYDTYAYKRCKNEKDHPLAYKIVKIGDNVEFAVVMSELPGNLPYAAKYELYNDELVFIPTRGQPQHFKNFSGRNKLNWVKKPILIETEGDFVYSWDSFPVLDTTQTAINTMTQSAGFSYATRVSSGIGEYIYRRGPSEDWMEDDSSPLKKFDSHLGYKITHENQQDPNANYGATIKGELCAHSTITLYPNDENWVGYWLANSQSVQLALGSSKEHIHSVQSSKWHWINGEISSFYDRNYPMEFGQKYVIKLKETIQQSLTIPGWINSRKPRSIYYVPPPTIPRLFAYEPGSDYQTIEVISIEEYHPILEVGIKPSPGEYLPPIGGAVYNGSPIQIFVNAEDYEGQDLELWFWDGVYEFPATQTIEVYDFKMEQWEPLVQGSLIAGNGQYHILRISGYYEPPQHFYYTPTLAQQEIVIESIQDPHPVYEVGVFAGATCIGASKIDGFPITIIAYPDGYEDADLTFAFWDGNYEYNSTDIIEMWDDALGDWQEVMSGDLIAGDGLYNLVRLVDNDDPSILLGGETSPNPFNPDVTIAFSLSKPSNVEVTIYNIRGQKVRTLANDNYDSGLHRIVWRGKNDSNQPVGSGVYFYRITAGKNTLTGKMLMLK